MNELYQRVQAELDKANALVLQIHVKELIGDHAYLGKVIHQDVTKEVRDKATAIMIRLKEIVREIHFSLTENEPDTVVYAVIALVRDTISRSKAFLEKYEITNGQAIEEQNVMEKTLKWLSQDTFVSIFDR